jgi:hypothetical protein
LNVSKLPPSGALIAVNTDCALPDWSIIMGIDGDQGAVTGQVISGARAAKLRSQQQTAKRSLHQPDRG